MATRLLLPRSQRVLLDGRPANGARLYTYVTGTTTPKPVYTDAARTIPHQNPVPADAAGAFPDMFPEGGTYRLVLEDGAGNLIFTADDVDGIVSSGGGGGSTTAALRNRLVNGAMQISQEHGTANVDVTTGEVYTLDQWKAVLSTTPGGTLRVAQVASLTPGGSPYRLRATAQVSDGSLATGDLYVIQQPIEGLGISDARFGTPNARQIILRFGVRSSIAGTFAVSITNSVANRSYVTTFSIAAGEINTDVVRSLIIPGDTAGTWLADTGIGILVRICLAAGTTYQGLDGWQAGNICATAAQTNFMGTGSATFELFDAGLYVDEAGSGVAPAWEYPDIGREVARCQRYYEQVSNMWTGQIVATGAYSAPSFFLVEKRAAPTATSVVQSGFANGGFSTRSAPVVTRSMLAATGSALSNTNGGGWNDVWAVSARL